jgi:hypothetical protein
MMFIINSLSGPYVSGASNGPRIYLCGDLSICTHLKGSFTDCCILEDLSNLEASELDSK